MRICKKTVRHSVKRLILDRNVTNGLYNIWIREAKSDAGKITAKTYTLLQMFLFPWSLQGPDHSLCTLPAMMVNEPHLSHDKDISIKRTLYYLSKCGAHNSKRKHSSVINELVSSK